MRNCHSIAGYEGKVQTKDFYRKSVLQNHYYTTKINADTTSISKLVVVSGKWLIRSLFLIENINIRTQEAAFN